MVLGGEQGTGRMGHCRVIGKIVASAQVRLYAEYRIYPDESKDCRDVAKTLEDQLVTVNSNMRAL